MLGVRLADHTDLALAAHDLALVADSLDAGSDLHDTRSFRPPGGPAAANGLGTGIV